MCSRILLVTSADDGVTTVHIFVDDVHRHTINEKRFGPEFSQTLALKWLRRKKLVPVIFNGESLAEHCDRWKIGFSELVVK